MKVNLQHGARYRAVAAFSHANPLAMQLINLKLESAGFRNIVITGLKDGVEVRADYTGPDTTIELEQAVRVLERTA
jgi:hypothetical protein